MCPGKNMDPLQKMFKHTDLLVGLGMLVIVVLYKALIYLGLQAYYQTLAKGLVLLAVVAFDSIMTRRLTQAR